MPILPIIDLLILMGWTSLFGAFALKAIYVTTSYHPSLFGLGPMDLTILSAVLLLFALALAARTWVKSTEVKSVAPSERAVETLEAYALLRADADRDAGMVEGADDGVVAPAPRGPHSAVSA